MLFNNLLWASFILFDLGLAVDLPPKTGPVIIIVDVLERGINGQKNLSEGGYPGLRVTEPTRLRFLPNYLWFLLVKNLLIPPLLALWITFPYTSRYSPQTEVNKWRETNTLMVNF